MARDNHDKKTIGMDSANDKLKELLEDIYARMFKRWLNFVSMYVFV